MRHMDAMHPNNPLKQPDGSYRSYISDDDELSSTESNSDHDEQSADDTDMDGEDDDVDADNEDEDEEDSPSVWAKVITHVVQQESDNLKNSAGIVKASKVVMAIKTVVNNHLDLADEIRQDNVFLKIAATKDRLISEGYDSDEATEAAWENRKYLVEKEIIYPNKEILLSDSEEEEEDDEMEEYSQPNETPAMPLRGFM